MLAFLRNQGGTRTAVFELDGSWSSYASVHHGAQHHVGKFFSRLNPILGSRWTLNLSVFQKLRRRWPVSTDLFATSLPHRCFRYFSPFHNPNALGMEFLLQPWDGWQAYAFPPYALIPAVL